ncbi:DNA polymerase III subunit delta' [Lentzea cavernae]|uniref:DNA polymerase III subunit delta n=1 Tax=Lentzea cavernae TaxID=2020703 RepID=A0ABQ3MN65_9PSEU|nr:DNA polymerase III subunit delta' [Lentzea cavernae]GHH49885.1 DNA polymerase III subunit delta' [Lentzea cavernae]
MSVWDEVVGQPDAVATLSASAEAAATIVAGGTPAPGVMTHAWLFTGPPGSGRSSTARAFAGALQCVVTDDRPGCGACSGCRTTLHGTHADVRVVAPEGLSISVAEMRSLVQISARRPTSGRWQVVIIEDADRLTEGAANALLKAVEEPPARTVFLLCAPSDHPDDVSVTIRSRCRLVSLGSPRPAAIASALEAVDGVSPEMALWAASVCGGHVGRARRLAADELSRSRREAVLRIPLALRKPADVFTCADELIKAAEDDASTANEARNEAEREALETAMGAGGTGKGTATASRGAKGALKDLEKRQKSRATRTQRDSLDMALVDLAGFYRDALVTKTGSEAALMHPDRAGDSRTAAATWSAESILRRIEAVLACREAIEVNVKPRIAIEAMVTTLHRG